MKKRYTILILITLVTITYLGCDHILNESKGEKVIETSNVPMAPATGNSLICHAIVGADINYDYPKPLKATVHKTTQRLDVEISDSEVRIKGGYGDMRLAAPNQTADEILAFAGKPPKVAHTFFLNRRNGLAVWSKVRSDFIIPGYPDGSVTYFHCQ
ncbi:MAG: hypothetical protein KJ687_05790 [Proteobacteria bacterium]|nr:hypothetical protein [Pseudomonadota bacterium]